MWRFFVACIYQDVFLFWLCHSFPPDYKMLVCHRFNCWELSLEAGPEIAMWHTWWMLEYLFLTFPVYHMICAELTGHQPRQAWSSRFGCQHMQLFKQMQIGCTIELENCYTRVWDHSLWFLNMFKFKLHLVFWSWIRGSFHGSIWKMRKSMKLESRVWGFYFDSTPINYVTIILSVGPSVSPSSGQWAK